MERHQEPFLHFVKDDFLSEEEVKKIRNVYEECVFKELHTDLYRFLQTDELGRKENLEFFRARLMEEFGEIDDVDGGWLVTFGSYYTEGGYLLCHDDRIETRKFAYSYYLDDYDSGELILYERDCITMSKKIEVKSNRLVIFEVSDVSFHEVGYCEKDGRKAFTGWLNFKHIKHSDEQAEVQMYELSNYEEFPFEVDFGEDVVLFYPAIEYDFEYVSKMVEGPFCSRRLERLVLERPLVPTIEGWSLLEGNFYHLGIGDYILLNDRCNKLDGEIYDVFFIRCEGNIRSAEDEHIAFDDADSPIKYLDGDGKFVCSLPVEDQNMFVVKRGKLSFFIERCRCDFFLAHFIYRDIGKLVDR